MKNIAKTNISLGLSVLTLLFSFSSWATEVSYVTQVTDQNEVWSQLPSGFTQLGQNIYHIKDPAGKVRDFVISGAPKNKATYFQAKDLCESQAIQASLPTEEQLQVLQRALGYYDADEIYRYLEDMKNQWIWIEGLRPNYPIFSLVFNGSKGDIYYAPNRHPETVRCVRTL